MLLVYDALFGIYKSCGAVPLRRPTAPARRRRAVGSARRISTGFFDVAAYGSGASEIWSLLVDPFLN
jgi:hypothetical protein